MSSSPNEPEIIKPGHAGNPEVTFESRDLSSRAVLGFLIALAIAGVLVHVGLWGIYKYMAGRELQPAPAQNAIMTSNQEMRRAGGDPQVMFPAPRLQPNPVADLNKFRVHEEEVLNSYGWVDRASGKVHIPIEQAIAILAQTGLPTRAPGHAPPGAPAEISAESSGGVNPSPQIPAPSPPGPLQARPGTR
jgi:hypothetical protein